MTVHDLINRPGTAIDVSGRSCITSLIDADSIAYIVGWHHRDEDDAEKVAMAVDQFVHDMLAKTQARQYAGFFSDKITFRHQIYPAYKATRRDPHPGIQKWKPYITEYCMQMWHFDKLENLEADDAVASLQRNMLNTIICSPDKDLRQIPGNHFDYKKDQKIYIAEEEGVYNWAYQMIVGDTGDNIKGVPGLGPKAAEKIIPPVGSGLLLMDSCSEIVRQEYIKKFGDDEQFLLHCQLIGMGSQDISRLIKSLHTFDLDSAVPSDYFPVEDAGKEAEDLFGSWE